MTLPTRTRPGDLMLEAARMRVEAEACKGTNPIPPAMNYADRREAQARTALPETMAKIGTGRELVPVDEHGYTPPELRDTVDDPDRITAVASRDRLELAHEAGALDLALDMADTIEARNSLEKMLAHQLAAAHNSAMKLTAQLNRSVEWMQAYADVRNAAEARQAANLEACRLAGAITRLMAVSQQGALTLKRMRSGGQQVVTVQYVTVAEGGQAIVAGRMTAAGRGRRRGGGGQENGE